MFLYIFNELIKCYRGKSFINDLKKNFIPTIYLFFICIIHVKE